MKKMILTLAIAVSTVSAFAGEVTPKVLDAFNSEFTTAKEVEWTASDSYYMATFTYNGKHVFAYYNTDGVLLGLTRYISQDVLSMNLQNNLKKNYSEYWISDLFEVAKNGRTDYYVTLENADKKIVLQASGGNEWSVFKKVRKA